MLRILYLDDNDMNREILARTLTNNAFEVVVADNGRDGIEKAAKLGPDLVLLDINLPDFDRVEVVAQLKAIDKEHPIPVIALVNHGQIASCDRALKAGCDDFVTRPVNIEVLCEKIGKLTRKEIGTTSAGFNGVHRAEISISKNCQAQILVVDDDRNNLLYLRRKLESAGFAVKTSESGREALVLIESEEFVLVLLDIMMPVMSGFDVLVEIRKTYTLTELPVIMVTAMDQSADVVRALGMGANGYITKPVDLQVLLAHVQIHYRIFELENELNLEKDFKESLIESAYEMIISVDLNRKITGFNKAAEKTLGYDRSEVLGRDVSILYSDQEIGFEVHNRTLDELGFAGEIINKRKDGTLFPSFVSVSVLTDKNNNPLGLVGMSMDISERKKIEEERRRLQKMKGYIVSMASHDLKNPLLCIMGHAYFLEKSIEGLKGIPREFKTSIDNIQNMAEVMQGIVEDFLDFQAIQDGRLVLKKVEVNLNEIAQTVADQNRHYAKAKGVCLTARLSDIDTLVIVDKARIRQVLQNFVDNALKYSPTNSEVEIRIRTEDNRVIGEVSDTGPGLSDVDMLRAFNPFTTLENRPTGGETSSGLGLAICRQFVEMHGGQIGVRNNTVKGTTFWFSINIGNLDTASSDGLRCSR